MPKLKDPFDIYEWWAVPLLISYVVLGAAALLGFMALVVSTFDLLPFGIPILLSPPLLLVLWKGIDWR